MTPAMLDIIDIEPVQSHWMLFLSLGIILIFILLTVLALYGIKKWKKVREKENSLTPLEAALADLEKLKKQKLIETQNFKKFYFFLTEILKSFLGHQYQFNALMQTTEELHLSLKEKLSAEAYQKIVKIFERADVAKYASRNTLSEEVAQADLSTIEGLIQSYDVQ